MNDITIELEQNNENVSTSVNIDDSIFESEVIQSTIPVLLHFSLESQYDLQINPILEELFSKYSGSMKFVKINISENTLTASKYAVTLAPSLLIFVQGKVVAQIVGVVSKDTISAKIDLVLQKSAEELPELSFKELKKAYKQNSGSWNNALTSGLVSGVIYAFSLSHFKGTIAILMVPGLAYAFCIQNKNFRFSWLQKIFATGLMIYLGWYWREILQFVSHYAKP
jgi:thioredoxin 1